MWDVPLIGNRKPQLELLYLLVQRLFINFNTSLEADGVDLLLVELMELVDVEGFVFSANSLEIHVKLSCENHSRNDVKSWSIDWDLDPDANLGEDTQDVVDDVEASDWFQAHEM